MRMPKYLSPSSFKLYESDLVEFYLKYLADNRPPRMAQTRPMSVGSAFDAYVKSYLYYCLFGSYGAYEKDALFEAQVEPQNRDWAREAGQYVFDSYKNCGALGDLMLELSSSVGKPRFEFEIQGTVENRVGSVPLLGKPDVFFISDTGARVILDWKVNGYCSNSAVSPMPGYVMVRDAWQPGQRKPSRNNRMPHKDCFPTRWRGMMINPAARLEDLNSDWAVQLSVYAWLLGEEVGSTDLVIGVDQICGCGDGYLKVASHRLRAGANFQYGLLDRLTSAWAVIQSGHIFRELSRQDSDAKCEALEFQATALADTSDPVADFVNKVSRAW